MEEKHNISRLGVQIGDISEETTKSSFSAKLTINKEKSDAQLQRIGSYLTGLGSEICLVVVFTPEDGKIKALQELLEALLTGSFSYSAPIRTLVKDGLLSYSFVETPENLVLRIKAGEALESMASGMIPPGLATGMKDIAAQEELTLELNLRAGIDFHDLLGLHKSGYSTLSAFCKSFQVELIRKALKGSTFWKKYAEIMKNLMPFAPQTPLPLFDLLEAFDVDVTFKSIDEAPEGVRKMLGGRGEMAQFPRAPKIVDKDDYEFAQKLAEVLKSNIKAYATVPEIAAVEIDLNVPGFGVCATTKQE